MKNVLEMKGITKVFPGVIANENVDFELREGEIHVLLGENGAGKTTLMNVLYGLYSQEKGDILINENIVKINNPSQAIKLGIGMVHQHFMLVNNFTVAENIILGSEPKKGICLDMNKANEEVSNLADKYGFNINPKELIEDITVGKQQKVEILKALYRGAKILILDEPTAVLTPQEITELGLILKNLVNEGKSIILITHKLKEIMKMSDRVTILRRGKVIDTISTKDTNIDDLAEKMVGRKVNLKVYKKECKLGNVMLSLKNVEALDNRKLKALKGINLEVKSGEILGIAGVDGNGQKELVEVITGLRKCKSGNVEVKGSDMTNKSPKDMIDFGVSSIPEDRHKRGLILNFPLVENSILGSHKKKDFSNGLVMNYKKIIDYTKKLIKDFDVRTSDENALASGLSGGNQQKFIAAREINKNPDVLIAVQPTRGLDVGAIEYIHKRLIEERDKGKAILLVSLELDEIMNLSDRIAVIYDGNIVGVVNANETNEQELGILMAGGTLNTVKEEINDEKQ